MRKRVAPRLPSNALGYLLAACVMAFVLPAPSAIAATNSSLARISGGSPFPHGCPGEQDPYQPGYEGDAALAVDPSDAHHVAAVWTADMSYVLGRATMLAVSHNGGRTFGPPRVVKGFTTCSGGPSDYHNSYNPQVTIGRLHRIYIAAITKPSGTLPPPTPTSLTWTDDDGKSFGSVTRLDTDPTQPADSPALMADPRRPGHVAVAWIRVQLAPAVANELSAQIYASRTTDGGANWSAPQPVTSLPLNTVDAPAGGVYSKDGALRLLTIGAVFDNGTPKRQRAGEVDLAPDLATVRSTKQYVDAPTERVSDPDDSSLLAENRPDPGWAQSGRFLTWMTHEASGWVVRGRRISADGAGPARVIVRSPVPLLHLQPAAPGSGRLLLGSYDWRGHAKGAKQLLTAFHVAQSGDGGRHWSERRVTGRFDLRTAKDAYGIELFLTHTGHGAELPHGALLAIPVARPVARAGKTDVFVGRITFAPN